jgi:hypothetical protein
VRCRRMGKLLRISGNDAADWLRATASKRPDVVHGSPVVELVEMTERMAAAVGRVRVRDGG